MMRKIVFAVLMTVLLVTVHIGSAHVYIDDHQSVFLALLHIANNALMLAIYFFFFRMLWEKRAMRQQMYEIEASFIHMGRDVDKTIEILKGAQ